METGTKHLKNMGVLAFSRGKKHVNTCLKGVKNK